MYSTSASLGCNITSNQVISSCDDHYGECSLSILNIYSSYKYFYKKQTVLYQTKRAVEVLPRIAKVRTEISQYFVNYICLLS